MPPCPAAVGGVRRFVDISVPRNICPTINDLKEAEEVGSLIVTCHAAKLLIWFPASCPAHPDTGFLPCCCLAAVSSYACA